MERKDFIELMNTKKIYSRFSDTIVTFVEEITEDMWNDENGVYSDGMTLYDGIGNVQDDIQQMYCKTKKGNYHNMEDFYSAFGAYVDMDEFYNNVKEIIADR